MTQWTSYLMHIWKQYLAVWDNVHESDGVAE